ncbi:hypothetical protein Lepto1489_21310 [Leptospira interrogans serovar Bataviae]|uniref:Uncharacterized protein n=1 Tax=Leptospira interrogans serovar Bataviae TaxID=312175 RepID=A0AAP9WNC1_LEPIR|nr:hypothetical protein Lepto1489_21310 [Leptospira interrogans serovar Bataviae]
MLKNEFSILFCFMKWSIEVILLIAAKEFFNNFSSVKHNRSNVLLSLNIQSFSHRPRITL